MCIELCNYGNCGLKILNQYRSIRCVKIEMCGFCVLFRFCLSQVKVVLVVEPALIFNSDHGLLNHLTDILVVHLRTFQIT